MNGTVSAPSPGPVTDSAYAWRRLAWSVLIGIVSNASLWTSVALMPALQAEFGLGRTEAAYPYIAIMLGFLVGSPALGRWTDRAGITPVLIGAALLSSLGYLLGGWTEHFGLFLVTQLLVGIGTAVGFAPLAADLSHWFRRHRGLAMAIVSSSGYLSGIVWSAVIARVLSTGSWRDVHLMIGLALLVIVPLAFSLARRVPAEVLDQADRASADRARDVGISPTTIKWLLALAGIGCCIAMAMPQVHIVALCMDLGFTVQQGNSLLSLMLIGGVVSRLVSGLFVDRIGAVRILLIGSVLQMLALFLYIPFDGLASLSVVSLIFGLAQGGILPAYPLIVRDYLPARAAGAAIGTVATATQFGMAFGSWLSGFIHDQSGSYFLAFANGIAFNLMNILIVGLLLLRMARPPAVTA